MSSEASSKCTVCFPPDRPKVTQPSIIIYGSIEPSPTSNWTTTLASHLSSLPITILNPRLDGWDDTWREDINFAPFKEQVDWEMDHAAVANVIVFYFKPGTSCPISLLELGMCVGMYNEKVVVGCPKEFYKRGNVEIVCRRFGIELVEDLNELGDVVKRRLEALLENV
ncbi:hypothetical protein CC80DRAFT_496301 [Byssothecium circinans]|uniref:Nucleoside 2-deoxyribosyltransferase domain-containing protein n=1 Tax=Byssothecium circinans TaxID=147558 RepID=A0A6A5TGX0_9PLEO|nr:hypothetical protein CC80DRAFT_496301 [Byssothecium circinans]